MNKTIRELIRVLKADLILGDPKTVTRRAVVDSRSVKPGDLFFALKGARSDGHEFAESAVRAGAAGVVVSQIEWIRHQSNMATAILQVENPLDALRDLGKNLRNDFDGPVIGVTGSNGKTTTKQMIAAVMKASGPGLATQGNLNSQIGLPLVLSSLAPNQQWMVLEMGASEPGHIAALADIAKPKIGVLTSIGPAHLKTFGSLANIASSKWELMDALPFDGTAIIPWGEPLLEPHVRGFSKKIIFFGEDASCPVRASNIEVGEKVRFKLHLAGASVSVSLPVAGRFNVMNALAAAAVGYTLGRPIDEISRSLESFEPPAMRMEPVSNKTGALIFNDAYNANPASMIQSVRSLVESFPDRKKILVLGSMLELGEDEDRMHFHVGNELAKLPLERVFLYGPETQKIFEGAEASGGSPKKFLRLDRHEEIAAQLKSLLNKDTVVLVKGSRGTEMEKVIALVL